MGQKFYDAVISYYTSKKKNSSIPSQLIDVNNGSSSAIRTLGRWIQKAKEIFRRVIVGFLIMLLAYLVVKNLVEKLSLNNDVKGLFMNLFK